MTTGLCSCLRKTFHPTVRTKLNWAQWEKQWKVFLNEGPFSRMYLQEQLHVFARTVARTCEDGCKYLWVQMQCTAMAVAVHCVEGCTALCPGQTYQFQNASLDIGEMFPSGVKT